MLKANQSALAQNINQSLINCKQDEMNYCLTVNSSFGIQAALLGGFTYAVFTQNVNNMEYACASSIHTIYWVAGAISIASCIHVIIATMLIQVYGAGLALYGPVGSLAKSIDAMRDENKSLFVAYSVMIVFFSITTILSFWVVMTPYGALGSSLSYLVAARYWYYYCERVYLRFYWDEGEAGDCYADTIKKLDEETFIDDEGDDNCITHIQNRHTHRLHGIRPAQKKREEKDEHCEHAEVDPVKSAKLKLRHSSSSEDSKPRGRDTTTSRKSSSHRAQTGSRYLRYFAKIKQQLRQTQRKRREKRHEREEEAADVRDNDNVISPLYSTLLQTRPMPAQAEVVSRSMITQHPRRVAIKSYLLEMQEAEERSILPSFASSRGGEGRKVAWVRRFYVMNYSTQLYYYSTRNDYRADPQSHINKRPLVLSEYEIRIFNSAAAAAAGKMGNETAPIFQMSLFPKEDDSLRSWVLRMDTEEELKIWTQVLQLLCPQNVKIA